VRHNSKDAEQQLELVDAPDVVPLDVDPAAAVEERLGLRACRRK
jgi:hypothetical protein